MLEAMACGMPVVALANTTSPITDQVDGFTSYDPAILQERLQTLLENPDLARQIGQRGRETVARRFSMETFVEKWKNVIYNAADSYKTTTWGPRAQEEKRPKALIEYFSSPITTGRYFEEAARRDWDVHTVGHRVSEKVLTYWGFPEKTPPYATHQIDLPLDTCYQTLSSKLPQGYQPDFLLWIDSGHKELNSNIDVLTFPKIAYFIDTHVAPDELLEMATHFDCVFLAQKGQLELFKNAGIEHVFWVPLGCSNDLHDVGILDRIYDIAYVGSFSAEEHDRRRLMFDQLKTQFPNNKIGRFWPREMARIYGQSKIVVNACYNRDVNMRVFEALASGALLITDEAEGLEDLFQDRIHLVIYHSDDELPELIQYYLQNDEDRERIARAGQELALKEHTYGHRLNTILQQARDVLGPIPRLETDAEKKEQYYEAPRREIIPYVALKARRVLDVGCGAGTFGAALKKSRDLEEFVGIEIMEAAYLKAEKVLDRVLLGNIEDMELPFEEGYFDCIILADILEHLYDPLKVLKKLRPLLTPQGQIVMSIPNVRYYNVVDMLAAGAWTYEHAGILDSTHLRFYTRVEIERLLKDAGLEVGILRPLSLQNPDICPRMPDGTLKIGKVTLRNVDDEEYQDFITYQFIATGYIPGLDRLEKARLALEAGEHEIAYAEALDAEGVVEFDRWLIMARAKARSGQLTQAESLYKSCLGMKDDIVARGELGILYVSMGHNDEAKSYLEPALVEKPQWDRIQGALGLVYIYEEKYAEAYDLLKSALEGNFNNDSLISPFIAVAESLQRLAEAETVVKTFVEFYPGRFDLACRYARMLVKLLRKTEARERIQQILDFLPDHEEARELLNELDGNN
jgi:glycosyltransferase involved in cell wall biosynthesis